jgi:hypothetical protein
LLLTLAVLALAAGWLGLHRGNAGLEGRLAAASPASPGVSP